MSKIEIHDLDQLIANNYPPEFIQKLINAVLILSMQVKDDYPDYKNWFQQVQVPGIYDRTRNIIIAHINDKIVGFVSLKKTPTEKKICTFYVEKNFRKNHIGQLLVTKAVDYLEETKPLITIPMDKLNEFTKIANRYDWKITDIKENLYRTTTPEVIVNGEIKEPNNSLETSKTLRKTYCIYKINCLKQKIADLLNNPHKLWK